MPSRSDVPAAGRARAFAVVAAAGVLLACFAVLALLVHHGRFVTIDARVRYWLWPDGNVYTGDFTWPQWVAQIGVYVGDPAVTTTLFVLVAAWASIRRRAVRPALNAAVLVAVVGLAVVGVKHVIAVPDIYGSTSHLGGSFPSGHIVAFVCFIGGVLLISGTRSVLAWAAMAVLALGLGLCLLLIWMHWLTDVVGGALLGTALLALASLLPGWSARTRPARVAATPALVPTSISTEEKLE